MSSQLNYKSIATKLVNGEPLAYKALPDGGLAVIAPTGQKFIFTTEQVQAARQKIKPDPKPAAKPPTKRGHPQKSPSDSKKVSP
ncbi:MAG TPA: hypothetical protein DCL08_02835 [Anaerolineaceae bacterium]|jgi:hypothetical protein|nr:MAG: hypothetical protein XE06_0353 [Anaerolineaceae bacterium 46_22]HAF48160.1 hypothetical protein [Anaerolineaceae bacterium]